MASIRSKMVSLFLRYRHILKGRLSRTTSIDEATSIPKLREEVESGAEFFGKLPDGFTLEPIKIGALEAEWMLPPKTKKERAILYFHGGGLVVGSVRSHRGIVSKFVLGSQVPALVFDYALAPEKPFPSALNDAVAAYEYLLAQNILPNRTVFVGDSGGGNLCLATLLALKERNLPQPAGAVTMSAWTDLTNSSPSWSENAERDTLCWKEAQAVFSKMYCAGQSPENPLISPLFGDLRGLPPLLMFAGGDETLRDDTTRFAAKASKAGVDTTLEVGEGLFHCYPACAPLFPEAQQALHDISSFIIQKTSR